MLVTISLCIYLGFRIILSSNILIILLIYSTCIAEFDIHSHISFTTLLTHMDKAQLLINFRNSGLRKYTYLIKVFYILNIEKLLN